MKQGLTRPKERKERRGRLGRSPGDLQQDVEMSEGGRGLASRPPAALKLSNLVEAEPKHMVRQELTARLVLGIYESDPNKTKVLLSSKDRLTYTEARFMRARIDRAQRLTGEELTASGIG